MFSWDNGPITIGKKDGLPIAIPKIYLLFGGMTKDDIRNMIDGTPPEGRDEFIRLRQEAGDILTELGITPNNATNILCNLGEKAYAEGCREEWAIYAHKKVNGRSCGCVIAIIVLIVVIAYFIFK